MYFKKYDGFSFVEILVSLLLLSCIMLSFAAMQAYALRTLRTAYYFHLASVQVWQMSERLRALGPYEGLSAQVAVWNAQNLQLLPQGSGSVTGHFPNYTISIMWGGRPKSMSTNDGRHYRMHYQKCFAVKGTTLIELMLALMLSVLIIGSASLLYSAMQRNYSMQTAFSSLQENSRMAEQILTMALQRAGHIGCAKLSPSFYITQGTFSLTPANKITPFTEDVIKAGSQAFTVRQASAQSVSLVEAMQDGSTLHVSNEIHFNKGDRVIIANCQTVDSFLVDTSFASGANTQVLTTQSPLPRRYSPPAEINLFEENTYFIGKTTRVDQQGHAIYALFIKKLQQPKAEWVEGVEDMQISYDVLVNNHLVTRPTTAVDGTAVAGVAVQLRFVSLGAVKLQKNEFIYVALREK